MSDSSDGCNTMKLSVTHEVIEAIFRTYPSVKMKHAQLVPDKMREEDFWVQFFQSQRFHRDVSTASKNLLSSCLADEEKSKTLWSVLFLYFGVCVCVCVGQKAGGSMGTDILNTSEAPEEVSQREREKERERKREGIGEWKPFLLHTGL